MIEDSCFLAIDPGKDTGWAWFVEVKGEWIIGRSGTCDGDDNLGIKNIIDMNPGQHLVIEDQHGRNVGKNRMGKKSLRTLLKRRHRWEIFCELKGMKIVLVNPATWQAYFKFNNKTDKDSKRNFAENFSQRDIKTHDEADAIMIGQWFLFTGGPDK